VGRNTTAQNLPADVFSVPTYFFDAGWQNTTQGPNAPIADDPNTAQNEELLLTRLANGTIRYSGAEHTNFVGGDTTDDGIHAGDGDDTVRGNGGNDRLEGDGGNDQIIGGAGDDIITDNFGDDVLKGGPGNDAIQGGPGGDLLQGNAGDDFIIQGSDLSETFGGTGDDIVFGGQSGTVIFGGEGADWLEGTGQADLLHGGNGDPFELGTGDGPDVLYGGAGVDDLIGEGDDDIIIYSPGQNFFDGLLGFDWVTGYSYGQAAAGLDIDLLRNDLLPPQVDPLASRYSLVESVSGAQGDDVIKGDSEFLDPVNVGGNELLEENLGLITGLDQYFEPGFGTYIGNVLLGGAGSDSIMGRGDDDIIDGDSYLRVQLEAPDGLGGLMRVDRLGALQARVFNGTLNPGDIDIVREIITTAQGASIDEAVYIGPSGDFDVTDLGDGRWIVDHVRGCGDILDIDICPLQPDGLTNGIDEGRDTLYNIEQIVFEDVTIVISQPGDTGLLRVTTSPALPSQITLDGVPMDTWALTWPKTPVGTYEVCFTDVSGFQTPGCQTVDITLDATTTVVGTFVANGWLRVQTSPALPGTITVNGTSTNDWGSWSDLPPGGYTVCFGQVQGFDAPACVATSVAAGVQTDVAGVYTPNAAAPVPTGFGQLRVTTTPAVPAVIEVDGVAYDRWGLTWVKLAPGAHEVCFGDVTGFTTPACQDITIVEAATTVVNGAYTQRGTIQVLTLPAVPSTVSIDGTPRNAWGVWTEIPAGTHTVCFGEVPAASGPPPAASGPPCQIVVVTAGQPTVVTGLFN
jgi:Ca2+-binding RTX toxin-like protein